MQNNQNLDLIKRYNEFLIRELNCTENEINCAIKDVFIPASHYNRYRIIFLILIILGAVCLSIAQIYIKYLFILSFLGGILLLLGFSMDAFMPRNLKKIENQLIDTNEQVKEEVNNTYNKNSHITDIFQSPDTYAKKLLFDKFFLIFGDFKFSKGHSYFDINNLIILPDKLSFDTDDCVSGIYQANNIKITEVYVGFKAFVKFFKRFICLIISYNFLILPPLCLMLIFLANYWPDILINIILAVLFFPVIILIKYLGFRNSRGLIIEIDMPKNFEGETVIFENIKSNFVINKALLHKFDMIELEDVEFNKKYLTYTTNQLEARYVLTTAFIERLKSIKFAFNAKYLRMLFRNNRITIFAEVNKDLFAMVKDGETNKKVFDELFNEMHSVLSLTDELKLNIKTGL